MFSVDFEFSDKLDEQHSNAAHRFTDRIYNCVEQCEAHRAVIFLCVRVCADEFVFVIKFSNSAHNAQQEMDGVSLPPAIRDALYSLALIFPLPEQSIFIFSDVTIGHGHAAVFFITLIFARPLSTSPFFICSFTHYRSFFCW